MDEGIPHELTERRLRLNADRVIVYPGVRFELDEQSIEATVFPTDGIRQAPVSPVDGRPMRRANKVEVEALLE
jgi:orotidine-5'-phosphate decarboxylase